MHTLWEQVCTIFWFVFIAWKLQIGYIWMTVSVDTTSEVDNVSMLIKWNVVWFWNMYMTSYVCSTQCIWTQLLTRDRYVSLSVSYLYPLAMVLILRASNILVSLWGRGLPTPQACERTMFSCKALFTCSMGPSNHVCSNVHRTESTAHRRGHKWKGEGKERREMEIEQSERNKNSVAHSTIHTVQLIPSSFLSVRTLLIAFVCSKSQVEMLPN